jgi:peptidoglycan L-alanyl-D-glutamate endopeptidase CwlK
VPVFSSLSKQRLETCDINLQLVFNKVIKHLDCTVLCGFRDKAAQEEAFRTGNSKKHWPNGEHNKKPSKAVDVLPYPINYKDSNQMRFFAGFVVGMAADMGIKIRWGGDWDRDGDLSDQAFNDLGHFELVD